MLGIYTHWGRGRPAAQKPHNKDVRSDSLVWTNLPACLCAGLPGDRHYTHGEARSARHHATTGRLRRAREPLALAHLGYCTEAKRLHHIDLPRSAHRVNGRGHRYLAVHLFLRVAREPYSTMRRVSPRGGSMPPPATPTQVSAAASNQVTPLPNQDRGSGGLGSSATPSPLALSTVPMWLVPYNLHIFKGVSEEIVSLIGVYCRALVKKAFDAGVTMPPDNPNMGDNAGETVNYLDTLFGPDFWALKSTGNRKDMLSGVDWPESAASECNGPTPLRRHQGPCLDGIPLHTNPFHLSPKPSHIHS